MAIRFTAGLITVFVLGAAAASAQPMSDTQRDRAQMQSDVGEMHKNDAAIGDLNAQIKVIEGRIHHEHGAKLRADVARSHELQAQANRLRGDVRQEGHQVGATDKDYLHDESHPH